MMFRAHYQPDPRIPGMGLGFFRVDLGGHAVVEHQGVLPGFNSQIFLAPDDGVGVMAFTNGSRNAATWLTAETERLLGDLIGAPTAVIRTDVPQHPEIWGDLCGWYRPRAQRTDMQAWSVLGAGVQVLVRRGRLMLRTLSPIPVLYRGLVLHPDDETTRTSSGSTCPGTEWPRPGSCSAVTPQARRPACTSTGFRCPPRSAAPQRRRRMRDVGSTGCGRRSNCDAAERSVRQ